MSPVNLNKGVFVLSLDVELAWGTRNRADLRGDYIKERDVIKKLLELCEKYQVQATWAVVGHLFLSECKPVNGVKHPAIVRPDYKWLKGDWFDIDPASNMAAEPVWYGKDIIDSITGCKVPQEIGCHTFSHVFVGEGCGEECFRSEIKQSVILAGEKGIKLNSMVFPRNQVGHLNILKETGFTSYRGLDKVWFKKLPGKIKKFGHVFDNYLIPVSPVVLPEKVNGLWNIPGSYFYPHRRGWAGYLPISMRVKKASAGLQKAAKKRKIFHMWFHPFNLAHDSEKLLDGIESIFQKYAKLRDQGVLENKTMGNLAEQL